MPSELARSLAAQAWCADATRHTEMDAHLADEFAVILDRYIEALQWCSGSGDFAPGGQAEIGWNKLCRPLLSLDPLPEDFGREEERPA